MSAEEFGMACHNSPEAAFRGATEGWADKPDKWVDNKSVCITILTVLLLLKLSP